MASSVARARCALVWKRERPAMTPRASVRQVRREESRERRHEVDATAVGDRRCQCLDVCRGPDDLELIAQPLDGGSGDRHRSLERVYRLRSVERIPHRRQQARWGGDQRLAGVEQHEVARAVGILRLSRLEAGLTDERGMLVAKVTGDRDLGAHGTVRARRSVRAGRRTKDELPGASDAGSRTARATPRPSRGCAGS